MFAFFLIVAAVLLILEIRSLRIPVEDVEFEHFASDKAVEQGQYFTLTSVYTNKTGRRIPFVWSEEYISRHIEIEGEESVNASSSEDEKADARAHKKTYSLFLRKNERVTHSVRARSYYRGVHSLNDCIIGIGDFMGIRDRAISLNVKGWVAVYPRKISDARIDTVVKGIMGDISVKSFIFEDPVLVRGYRDYVSSDPFHSISFKQSAKVGSLVVKEFDHTREQSVDIVFDAGFKGNIDSYFSRIESCFSVVRALCEKLASENINFRIFTNLCCSDFSTSEITVLDSDYEKVLQFLTFASRASSCKYDRFLSHIEKEFTGVEAAIIYVAQEPNKETLEGLEALGRKHNISTYPLWGSDFEEVYNDSKVL